LCSDKFRLHLTGYHTYLQFSDNENRLEYYYYRTLLFRNTYFSQVIPKRTKIKKLSLISDSDMSMKSTVTFIPTIQKTTG
jgi:hypothetical protein